MFLIVVICVCLGFGEKFDEWLGVPRFLPDLVILCSSLFLALKAFAHPRAKLSDRDMLLANAGPVIAFVVVCGLSCVLSGMQWLRLVVFLRLTFQYYVLFLAVVYGIWAQRDFRKLNTFLFWIMLVQLPIALATLSASGANVRVLGGAGSFGAELASGTLGGGAMGTTVPLMMLGFLLSFYLMTRKLSFVLMMPWFVLFSLITGKRAFPIVVLPFFLLLYWLLNRDHRLLRSSTNAGGFAVLGGVALATFLVGISLQAGLSPSREEGHLAGKTDPKYALKTAVEHSVRSTDRTGSVQSSGRMINTLVVLKRAASRGIVTFLFGDGPGVLVKSGLVKASFRDGFEEMGIVYGFTGFVWMFPQVGILGVFCYLWFHWRLARGTYIRYREIQNPYWKAIAGGVVGMSVVVFFDFLAYSRGCIYANFLPAGHLLMTAQVWWVHRNCLPGVRQYGRAPTADGHTMAPAVRGRPRRMGRL